MGCRCQSGKLRRMAKPIWRKEDFEGKVSVKLLRNGLNDGFLVPGFGRETYAEKTASGGKCG